MNWQPVEVTGSPLAVIGHSANVKGDFVYCYGGATNSEYSNTLTRINLKTREVIHIVPKSKEELPKISGHTGIFYGNSLIIFGGCNNFSATAFNDTYEFNTETLEWKKIEVIDGVLPEKRYCHTAILYGTQMIIFGGNLKGSGCYNNVWSLELESPKRWTEWQCFGELPPKRQMHSAVEFRGSMYIFGGFNDGTYYDDLWKLDLRNHRWSKISTSGNAPSMRSNHKTALVDYNLYVSAGYHNQVYFSDFYKLNLLTGEWERLPDSLPRCNHVCFANDDKLFIYAGFTGKDWAEDILAFQIKEKSFMKRLISSITNCNFGDVIFN